MKIWLDDLRPVPEGYEGAKSVNEAIQMIKEAENICLYTKLNAMVEKVRTEEMQYVDQALNRQKSTQ